MIIAASAKGTLQRPIGGEGKSPACSLDGEGAALATWRPVRMAPARDELERAMGLEPPPVGQRPSTQPQAAGLTLGRYW